MGGSLLRKITIAAIALVLSCLVTITLTVQAATITSCTFDKEIYQQGDTGVISVTVHNDQDDKIRVTELAAVIDYFYSDETVYTQTFFTNATLPVEILAGQSSMLHVPFTLPNNIASGYTQLFVRARTEIWNVQAQRWYASDTGIYEPVLCIESPYKEQFEQEQTLNQQLQEELEEQQNAIQQLQTQLDQQENTNVLLSQQLSELQAAYSTNTMIMVVLGVMVISLVAVVMFLLAMGRKPSAMHRPAA